MTFLVGDGVTPSNEGRGYVLRRVIRRAVQHGLRIGMETPFLPGLADTVIEQMGEAYPELVEHRREIHDVLAAEEERFAETLERGMKLFEEAAAKGRITGEDAFTLADDVRLPDRADARARARARARGRTRRSSRALMERASRDLARGRRRRQREARGGVRDERGLPQRVRRLREDRRAHADRRARGARRRALPREAARVAVLSRGRRPGHRRRLDREGGRRARRAASRRTASTTTRRSCSRAPASRRATACARSCRGTCASRRWRTTPRRTCCTRRCRRCSATTCARRAPRCVRTSCASTSRIRRRSTHEQRVEVERRVNEKVFENLPVRTFETPIEEARNLGAMMLFGEKYGDVVRVVEVPRLLARALRRHARPLDGRDRRVHDPLRGLGRLGRAPHRGPDERRGVRVAARARARVGRAARRARARAQGGEAAARGGRRRTSQIVDRVNGVVLVAGEGAEGRRRSATCPTACASRRRPTARSSRRSTTGAPYLVVNFDESLVGRGLDATRLVRELGKHIGGGGGGRPTLAEAGGKNPDGVGDALAAGKQAVSDALDS